MSESGQCGKVLMVDTNLFFVKRLADVLREKGFEPLHCSDAAYALTMIEWNMPVAILCATSARASCSFEIPTILQADANTRHIPVIAIGDRGQQSQLEALRAGYADLIDRRLGAEEIASHLVSVLASQKEGFKPTQMLASSETALDGRLSLVDLPGVIQMIHYCRQTGALHVNASATDGIIFFDTGEVIHAESDLYAGDDAFVYLIKGCHGHKDGVYKFIPGDAPTLRTVHRSPSALIMDALRELDEEERDASTKQESPCDPPQVEQPGEVLDDKPVTLGAPGTDSVPSADTLPPVCEEIKHGDSMQDGVLAPIEAGLPAVPPQGSAAISDESQRKGEAPSPSQRNLGTRVFDTEEIDTALNTLEAHLYEAPVKEEETHE